MADKDFIPIPLTRILLHRLFSRIHVSTEYSYKGDPCWEWTGSINKRTKYAQYGIYLNKWNYLYLAHRLFYRLFVAQLSPGLILDHLCRVQHCVNPAHLEETTHKVNTARG